MTPFNQSSCWKLQHTLFSCGTAEQIQPAKNCWQNKKTGCKHFGKSMYPCFCTVREKGDKNGRIRSLHQLTTHVGHPKDILLLNNSIFDGLLLLYGNFAQHTQQAHPLVSHTKVYKTHLILSTIKFFTQCQMKTTHCIVLFVIRI